jgi:hypothetical protein
VKRFTLLAVNLPDDWLSKSQEEETYGSDTRVRSLDAQHGGAGFSDLALIRNKSGLPEASSQPFRHLPAAE